MKNIEFENSNQFFCSVISVNFFFNNELIIYNGMNNLYYKFYDNNIPRYSQHNITNFHQNNSLIL